MPSSFTINFFFHSMYPEMAIIKNTAYCNPEKIKPE
jgi:hypothetical protein